MEFPFVRKRRLRRTETLRRMVRETKISVDDLIAPLFVVPGTEIKKEIKRVKLTFYKLRWLIFIRKFNMFRKLL